MQRSKQERRNEKWKTCMVLDHPLIQHKLTLIRDKNTGAKDFREVVKELSMLMAYEVTRHLPLEEVEIETPMGRTGGESIIRKKIRHCPDFESRFRNGRWNVKPGTCCQSRAYWIVPGSENTTACRILPQASG